MNDVQDMCKYVAQLRPKSLQDFKPLLILCQSLLQDFIEGRRFLYSREIFEMQKRHSFETSNYLETIEKLEEEIKDLKGGVNYQAKMGLMNKTLSMVASKKEKSMKEKVKEWEDQMNEMRAELEGMQAKLNSARIEKDGHRKKIEKFQRQLEHSTTLRKELEENNQALKEELAQITNGIPTVLLKDLVRVPALAKNLTNNIVRKQVADKVVFDMMVDTALMEVLVNPQLQQILKNPKFQANLSNPAFIQALSSASVISLLANPVFLRHVPAIEVQTLLTNEGFMSLVEEPNPSDAFRNKRLQQAMRSPPFVQALVDPSFIKMCTNDTLLGALSNPIFANAMANHNFISYISDSRFITSIIQDQSVTEEQLERTMDELQGFIKNLWSLQDLRVLVHNKTAESVPELVEMAEKNSDAFLTGWRTFLQRDANRHTNILCQLIVAMKSISPNLDARVCKMNGNNATLVKWITKAAMDEFQLPAEVKDFLIPELMKGKKHAVYALSAYLFISKAGLHSCQTINTINAFQKDLDELRTQMLEKQTAINELAMKLEFIKSDAIGLRVELQAVHLAFLDLSQKHILPVVLRYLASFGIAVNNDQLLDEFKKYSKVDWSIFKGIPGFSEDDVPRITMVVQKFIKQLRAVYQHYAQGGLMGANEFKVLLKDINVLDKVLTSARVDVHFKRVNWVVDGVADAQLEPHEYIGLLALIAGSKFEKKEGYLSAKFENIVKNYVIPYASQAEVDVFRKTLFAPDVRKVFAALDREMKLVFKVYQGLDGGREQLNAVEVEKLFNDGNILGNRVVKRDIEALIARVQANDDNEVDFMEFRELICVVALYHDPNPYVTVAKRLQMFLTKTLLPALVAGKHVKGMHAPFGTWNDGDGDDDGDGANGLLDMGIAQDSDEEDQGPVAGASLSAH